jgi:Putative capsular polysaccharide synthesis protein
MRSVARRLAGRSYAVSKQYALFRMRGADAPVVVFSMGKTGSTAIARAVEDAVGRRVFQVFRLEADRLAEAEQRYLVNHKRAAGRNTGQTQVGGDHAVAFPGALHLWESEYLLRHPPTAANPWRVITTVREPVAQAVSAFFHGSGRRGLLEDAPSVDALEATLLDEDWLRAPLRWFDREFAPALGVDVFDRPFDPEVGHGVIETPAVRVLLLRQENLDAAPVAVAGFLGMPGPVPVPPRNEASTKEYGGRYREFLASVRLTDPVLDQVYGSRYARHFYADSELERFRRRWSNGPQAC